jgi:hypothetical protein
MKNIHRIEETAKVQERIEALEYAIECTRGRRDKATCLGNILAEYTSRLTYLGDAKEYMVHFEGGGWNTCYGRDEEEAFVNAELEHNRDTLKVRSVSLATSAGTEAAMRLFY